MSISFLTAPPRFCLPSAGGSSLLWPEADDAELGAVVDAVDMDFLPTWSLDSNATTATYKQ